MTRRIYVASSWRNTLQLHIVELLLTNGHQVYDFKNPPNGTGFAWSQIDEDWKKWDARSYRKKLLTHPLAARGFLSDKRAMDWADTCVLVMPCGRSAHLELGYMAGQNKRAIILLSEGEEPELMNLLVTDICVTHEELLRALE